MKRIYNTPIMGETYMVSSKSRLLQTEFGINMRIKIQSSARKAFGNNFMELPRDIFHVCSFYAMRYDAREINDPGGEVYLGTIGLKGCLINVSELVLLR